MANTLAESGKLTGRLEIPVYYEDTDLSGFVYHANYLKFFERAREHIIGIEFLRDLHRQHGVHFVVSKTQLDYRSPAQHGDRMVIESEGLFSRSPALPFTQNAYVIQDESWQPGQLPIKRLLVAGQVTIVALNAQNRPIRMPDLIIERFLAKPHDGLS